MQLRPGTEVRVSVLGGVGCGRVVRPGGTAMSKDGTGKMYCLAGIGWRVDAIMANTRGAARVLAIHGCAQECARRTLELAGFSGFEHLKLWEMGFKKGETLLTPERIRVVADAGGGCCPAVLWDI
ncbi:MAG TPA: putative zinc-binding protein [Verrucomicrobiae bacterium]|nr:putative zinc-binding protein [Verrucomicrobiae bacterium]